MQRWICLGLLLLAGCQNVIGPRERRMNQVKVDHPFLTIDEQERLARDQLAFPQQSREIAPPTYAGLPEPRSSR